MPAFRSEDTSVKIRAEIKALSTLSLKGKRHFGAKKQEPEKVAHELLRVVPATRQAGKQTRKGIIYQARSVKQRAR